MLDYLVNEFNEIKNLDEDYIQEDAALTLLSGEMRSMINDLMTSIGPDSTAAKSTASEMVLETA